MGDLDNIPPPNNIVELKPGIRQSVLNPSHEEALQVLEKTTQLVKKDKIDNVLIMYWKDDGQLCVSTSILASRWATIGALELVKSSFLYDR